MLELKEVAYYAGIAIPPLGMSKISWLTLEYT